MKLLIAGGGTGGHVFPALAVASEWTRRGGDREVIFAGTKQGLEAKLAPQAGYSLETIRVAGLKGIGGVRLAQNAMTLLPALWDSAAILRRHRFAAALGTGGYASGPLTLMAALRSVPTIIFEPNVRPGFTNRVLAEIATRVAVANESTAELWGHKAVVTGCPVRREFFGLPRREHASPFHILVTGGSQGSHTINQAMANCLDHLATKKSQLFIVHQTGERDYNAVRAAYEQCEFPVEVVPFIENMAERFAQADLIICRSGAITVAEVAAAGRVALFIPFRAATDSHQLSNAQAMEHAGAARVIPEEELTPERVSREIFSLLGDSQKMTEMERRAAALARPQAAEEIIQLIEAVARQ